MKFMTHASKETWAGLMAHRISIHGYCVLCTAKHIVWADERARGQRGLTDEELTRMVMDYGGPDAWQYSFGFRSEKFDPTNRHFV